MRKNRSHCLMILLYVRGSVRDRKNHLPGSTETDGPVFFRVSGPARTSFSFASKMTIRHKNSNLCLYRTSHHEFP